MRRTLTALFITAVIGAPAFAADLPIRPAPRFERPAPIVEQTAYNWTGFYIGGHAGYNWMSERESYEDKHIDFSQTIRGDNWTYGGQVGAQKQYGSVVLGVEADWSWMDVGGSLTNTECVYMHYGTCKKSFSTIDEPRLKWMSTARLRIGYAFDRTLVYATGGGAFGLANISHDEWYDSKYHGISGMKNISSEQWFGGWVAGGGIEHAFTSNLSVGLQYLYANLGSIDTTVSAPWSHYKETMDVHSIRFVLNYKL